MILMDMTSSCRAARRGEAGRCALYPVRSLHPEVEVLCRARRLDRVARSVVAAEIDQDVDALNRLDPFVTTRRTRAWPTWMAEMTMAASPCSTTSWRKRGGRAAMLSGTARPSGASRMKREGFLYGARQFDDISSRQDL